MRQSAIVKNYSVFSPERLLKTTENFSIIVNKSFSVQNLFYIPLLRLDCDLINLRIFRILGFGFLSS